MSTVAIFGDPICLPHTLRGTTGLYFDWMRDLTDEQLVALFQEQNSSVELRNQAVSELFGRYQAKVAAWCYRVAGDRDGASDLAQETFLRALRALPSFRSEAKFSTWLYTIARNHSFNAREALALRPQDDIDPEMPDTGDRIDDLLETAGEIREMRNLLNRVLDETERTVMTLHYGEEMTLPVVTRLLGLENASGAKAYVVSAKRKLKAAVARWKSGGDLESVS